jgi:hypothetical protein
MMTTIEFEYMVDLGMWVGPEPAGVVATEWRKASAAEFEDDGVSIAAVVSVAAFVADGLVNEAVVIRGEMPLHCDDPEFWRRSLMRICKAVGERFKQRVVGVKLRQVEIMG